MQKMTVGILAGGKSTRMGRNKALLAYQGKTFLEIIRDEMSDVGEVLISGAQKGIYENYGCRVLYDEQESYGPLAGIYQLLKAADTEYVFLCAVDMPFLKKELVQYMQGYLSSDFDCFCMQDEQHIHPLCAIYSKRMLPLMEKLIQEDRHRLTDLLNQARTKYISVEMSCFDKKMLQNVNTMQEYRKMCLPVVFCVSGIKNSGKTTLIEHLTDEFIKNGYRVGVIKHDGHAFEIDHKGTDTYRFSQRGADCCMIYSAAQYAIMGKKEKTAEALISYMKAEKDIDVIIIEGEKGSLYPKVEIVRAGISDSMVCRTETLICVASDILTGGDVVCPVVPLQDTAQIYACVTRYFQIEDEEGKEVEG